MIVKEGLVRLKIPKDYQKKKHFFNPKMELARDLTVLILKTLDARNWVVCDALSGIGARGIRIAKECNIKVWLNDVSEDVRPFLKKNIELNNVKQKVKIINQDANQLLSSNRGIFNYIDIDPFGSPCYYFDSCARSVKRKGLVAFTATDTAPLAGTNPMTCMRRYGVKSFKTDFFKELGLRVLITSIVLSFSKWSLTFKPLLSYSSEHYYRVWGRVEKGKVKVNKTIDKNFRYVNYCPKCLWRKVDKKPVTKCGFCGSGSQTIGKVWLGDIEDIKFIQKCQKKLSNLDWLKTKDKIEKLLNLLKNESIPLYYDVHKLCQKHEMEIPKFRAIIERLEDRGYKVGRTHFSNKGIKTDASVKDLIEKNLTEIKPKLS